MLEERSLEPTNKYDQESHFEFHAMLANQLGFFTELFEGLAEDKSILNFQVRPLAGVRQNLDLVDIPALYQDVGEKAAIVWARMAEIAREYNAYHASLAQKYRNPLDPDIHEVTLEPQVASVELN